jgi:transcriptional regulator with XRE-family HTH domain
MTQERINPGVASTRGHKGTSTFSDEENAKLRALVQKLLTEKYKGNVSALARAIGVSQAGARKWAKGTGAGFRFDTARQLAKIAEIPLSQLVAVPRVVLVDEDTSPDILLEQVLQYWEDRNRWSPMTIAVARSWAAQKRPSSKEAWEDFLDRQESLFREFLDSNVPPKAE